MFINKMFNAKREKLSDYAHDAWSRWMKYLFSKCIIPIHKTQGGLIIPQLELEKWKRKMETSYNDLSEEEKESDRNEADKIINICNGE